MLESNQYKNSVQGYAGALQRQNNLSGLQGKPTEKEAVHSRFWEINFGACAYACG